MTATDWSRVSTDAKLLIKSMLKTDPNERISAADAYHNQWIQKNAPNIPLNTKMFNNLKNFHVLHKKK